MTRLPNWTYEILKEESVHIFRYGTSKGRRPKNLPGRYVFSGWFYHQAQGRKSADGPYGPFATFSAAMADALRRYGLEYADQDIKKIIPMKRRAA